MWATVPPMVGPDFVARVVTITPMSAGSGPLGGFELFPGPALQADPHDGVALSAKPLKLLGAPLGRMLFWVHWAPQKRTAVPGLSVSAPLVVRGPMTKAPPGA